MFHQNKCTVTIKGMGQGILLHNPLGSMGKGRGGMKVIPVAEEEAKGALYWTDDKKSLGFPAYNFHRGMIAASTGFKLPSNRKLSLSPVIAGDVTVHPSMISFEKTDYEIFVCRAVVEGKGVLRARPLLKDWQLTFEVHWESQQLGKDFHTELLPELLTKLGHSVGIGDFRPAKKGPFGRFVVEGIEYAGFDPDPKTEEQRRYR